jgi:hypothetical protein
MGQTQAKVLGREIVGIVMSGQADDHMGGSTCWDGSGDVPGARTVRGGHAIDAGVDIDLKSSGRIGRRVEGVFVGANPPSGAKKARQEPRPPKNRRGASLALPPQAMGEGPATLPFRSANRDCVPLS